MPRTAVIVDDSTSMGQMVSFAMTEAGFSVLEAGNGQEGLKHLDGKRVELIITDLNMPVMDGITMLKQVRAKPQYKFTPILMLTTESQEAMKQAGRAAGATGWIVKPFNLPQLLQVIKKLVP